MLGGREKVTLFGRFRLAKRDEIERLLADRGAQSVRDLTRQTTLLVIGSGATNLIVGGRLSRRLAEARARDISVVGEARLLSILAGDSPEVTLPLAQVTRGLSTDTADLLVAFDLIVCAEGHVRFEDADALRSAAELEQAGMDPAAIVDSLRQRRAAPKGRHRLVTDAAGRAVLEWEDGTTTLSGQFMLPLDEGDSVETLFEEALDAEASGDLATALRLFETCARADRRDPVAPFNLGNVQTSLGDMRAARLSYQRAIDRDPRFAEAHFNLAGVLERLGDFDNAMRHLRLAVAADEEFLEPLFNLAQLERAAGNLRVAEDLFRRYLHHAGTSPLAEKAEKALRLIRHDRGEGMGR